MLGVRVVKWHEGGFVGYDLESTGTNPLDARIVTAAVVHVTPGRRPSPIQWLMDPGVDVPDDAAAVHGWTRPRILEKVGGPGRALRHHNGNYMPMLVEGALGEIAGHLSMAMHTETPVVIANAAYDCTLTEVELAHHAIDPLSVRGSGIRGVVDPMVIEKQWDPYRKVNREGGCRGGKYDCRVDGVGCGATNKQLASLCAHYGVRLTAAHDAAADALAAVRLAVKLASLWPDVARLRLPTLHEHQVTWRRQQADSLRAYFDRAGIEHDGVDPGWPLLTTLTSIGASA